MRTRRETSFRIAPSGTPSRAFVLFYTDRVNHVNRNTRRSPSSPTALLISAVGWRRRQPKSSSCERRRLSKEASADKDDGELRSFERLLCVAGDKRQRVSIPNSDIFDCCAANIAADGRAVSCEFDGRFESA